MVLVVNAKIMKERNTVVKDKYVEIAVNQKLETMSNLGRVLAFNALLDLYRSIPN
jgi:hypothetical protein